MLPNFKTALAVRGLKQVDLAFELKIPPSTISEIVQGWRHPDALTRTRIARRLGADEEWLFCKFVQIPKPTTTRVK